MARSGCKLANERKDQHTESNSLGGHVCKTDRRDRVLEERLVTGSKKTANKIPKWIGFSERTKKDCKEDLGQTVQRPF